MNKGKIFINSFSYRVVEVTKPPSRCFKCKKFGHQASTCHDTKVCGRCGKGDHEEKYCLAKENSEKKCVNCSENHPSYYRGCTSYKEALKTSKITKYTPYSNVVS